MCFDIFIQKSLHLPLNAPLPISQMSENTDEVQSTVGITTESAKLPIIREDPNSVLKVTPSFLRFVLLETFGIETGSKK